MSSIVFKDDNKPIGRVLFIVEGTTDEMYILTKIFTSIFNYQYERLDRLGRYRPSNIKGNPHSSIFVINTKESNIKDIIDADGYLDELFTKLINEYKFPVDKATIFYIFDRDSKSNTDTKVIEELIRKLKNSREPNDDFNTGLLLLSYPSIESFTASNYINNTFDKEMETGDQLKSFLHTCNCNYTNQRINKGSIELAINEMLKAITSLGIQGYNLDDFSEDNMKIYKHQEDHYYVKKKYKLLSMLCISLLDLGLIEIEN